ncbi:NADH dehydrogenase [ubiquinone] 1 alpha subcomplex subunit 13-B [Vitis vinifera]|uniref:NADH dehydrogenase [ubiquinone] 1 alpha subcomplex subunit 13 n=1 Tax=Vitis vinifera TaxID=29760 RepID=A0A438F116_VITVI|nr:NADH dehydrogenase [ubiquinone] 1 alpha subcomplex subunit 13-B [Vitis vinifera]
MTEAMIRKKPGMVSVKDMPILQDGPPPGGFAPVRYARRIPTKGPSAMAIFLAAVGAFSWGMYQVGQGNKIRRRSALEDMVLYVWISKFRALKCGEILGNVQ